MISQILHPSVRSSPSLHHLLHARSCGASKSRSFSSSSSKSFTKSSSTPESPKKVSQNSSSAAVTASSPSSLPTPSSSSASSFLRAQAALEEVDTDPRPKKTIPEFREEAWDGDEPQERALRRILEDSYKPLRVKVRFTCPHHLMYRSPIFNCLRDSLKRYLYQLHYLIDCSIISRLLLPPLKLWTTPNFRFGLAHQIRIQLKVHQHQRLPRIPGSSHSKHQIVIVQSPAPTSI